jgi:hypothetical protein
MVLGKHLNVKYLYKLEVFVAALYVGKHWHCTNLTVKDQKDLYLYKLEQILKGHLHA